MTEYRRGDSKSRKNGLWHWHPNCDSYPTKLFAVRKDKPLDFDLCARCAACAEESMRRSAS